MYCEQKMITGIIIISSTFSDMNRPQHRRGTHPARFKRSHVVRFTN
jgi:hypothetical protein